MTDLIFAVLAIVILAQEFQLYLVRKANAAQVKDLLNRLMSRDFIEYSKFSPTEVSKVVSVDELRRELQGEYEDHGIPVN